MVLRELNKEEKEILELLKQIEDPEFGLNIVDLGFIYDIIREDDKVKIKMTLTWVGCPLTNVFNAQITSLLKEHGYNPEIEFVFDPPWSVDMISEEGKRKLGLIKEEKG